MLIHFVSKINMASKRKPRKRTSGRDKNYFTLQTKLLITNEVFPTKRIYGEMKIKEVKGLLEFTLGIPRHIQRISYLDEGDLLDDTDVKSNDIVSGGTIQVRVWPMWRDLVEAVASNDIDTVFRQGVTQDTEYKTPNSEYMTKRSKKAWLAERAFVALCIAAHRGHTKLAKKLIETGANVNAVTPLGRTALHIASSQGHGQIVDLLLGNGADIDAVDCDGLTALMQAEQFGHKACGRHLFLFRWQQRAKKMQPSVETPLMAHQCHDSAFPVWKDGRQGQLYLAKVLPPGEFDGTGLGSKLYRPYSNSSFRNRYGSPPNLQTGDTITELHTEANSGDGKTGLPAIREVQSHLSIPSYHSRPAADMPPSYDLWLGTLKAREQKTVEARRKKEEKKKLEQEDKKREEAEKSQSYESWLAQQEKEGMKGAGKPFDNPSLQAKVPVEPSLPGEDTMSQQPLLSRPKGALREYLESLAERRGSSYSDWLIKKEIEMLDSVQARPVIKMK